MTAKCNVVKRNLSGTSQQTDDSGENRSGPAVEGFVFILYARRNLLPG